MEMILELGMLTWLSGDEVVDVGVNWVIDTGVASE